MLLQHVQRIINSGADANSQRSRSVRITNVMALISIALSIWSYVLLNLIPEAYIGILAFNLGFSVIFFAVVPVLNKFHKFMLAKIVLFATFTLKISILGLFIYPPDHYIHLYFLISVVAIFLLTFGEEWKISLVMLGVTLLAFVLIELHPFQSRIILDPKSRHTLVLMTISNTAIAIGILSFLFYSLTWKIENQLIHHADFDPLTGLLNRRAFSRNFNSNRPHNQHGMALLCIDVDNFKSINDTHGHDIGDKALTHVVMVLQSELREDSLFARIGGDELLVLLLNIDAVSARKVADRLRNAIHANPLNLDSEALDLSISIGGIWESEPRNLFDLMKAADTAMYEAKQNGRNCVHWHSSSAVII